MDWTGSEKQRDKNRDDCLYPNAKPTPKPTAYFIAEGTSSLMKRVGDKKWKPFKTTRDLEFDSVYRSDDDSLIFFCVGYLLCVGRDSVTEA